MHELVGEHGTRFLHHGDFSGYVRIQTQKQSVIVPFEDLKALFARYVSRKRISEIEQATVDELVG